MQIYHVEITKIQKNLEGAEDEALSFSEVSQEVKEDILSLIQEGKQLSKKSLRWRISCISGAG